MDVEERSPWAWEGVLVICQTCRKLGHRTSVRLQHRYLGGAGTGMRRMPESNPFTRTWSVTAACPECKTMARFESEPEAE